tara:strand:+ start:281 stop:913 length:633 start_codon:yes stop_codon:yes gene_type:complete
MRIGIIFSNSSNIGNIQKAILYLGHEPVLVSEKNTIPKLSHLIIPGVGSFPKMMKFLKDKELDTSIIDGAKNDLKILGICLGMHLLFERSNEFGITKGLSLLKGSVKKISVVNNEKNQVPNIGYHKIYKKFKRNEYSPYDKFEKQSFYFAHSFSVNSFDEKDNEFYTIDFENKKILAFLKNNSISGCQFHPELSGKIGLEFLETFINYTN